MVLSGTAEKHEVRYAKECPTLKVIYNVAQSTGTPVDRAFLEYFDSWVEDAKRNGKKIAFRCQCGCHRTGRLAAYYEIKFMKRTLKQATANLTRHGQWMLFYPHIYKQVRAINDYVRDRPCSTKRKYCVRETSFLELPLDEPELALVQ
jgi:protein-tyrosine phosphatase